MAKKDAELETYKKQLKQVESTIERGPWRNSPFLKAIGKKLMGVRQKLKNTISYHEALSTAKQPRADLASRVAERQGQLEVYISLYSTAGHDIDLWAKQLTNIKQLVISRPIYAEEKDIREWIRSHPDDEKEAYAAIYLSKKDLLDSVKGREAQDSMGNELVQTKGYLSQTPIVTQFCHRTGIYEYEKGELKRVADYSSHD